ncbi:hypothetical protein Pmani_029409 [Petrolisthes manimaculis]|uniref:Uncharacterized protein n=1 Tax=Petrolisthes manimaculis TaxID=1843537 RepID=A0AAE1NXM6_9EUCA|nr:hypothetical protein Pmani_029409 [Petrolisthes manimaculis]
MNGSEHEQRMEGNVPPTDLDLPPSYEEATSKNNQNQQQSLSQHLNPPTASPPIQPRPSPAPNFHRCDSQPYMYQLYSERTRADTRTDLPTSNTHHVPDHPSTCCNTCCSCCCALFVWSASAIITSIDRRPQVLALLLPTVW